MNNESGLSKEALHYGHYLIGAEIIDICNSRIISLGGMMKNPITILLDDESIKFTPEGKIAVFDAITSLSGIGNEQMVWDCLLNRWPELEGLCEPYNFSTEVNTLVTDGGGWETIQSALFDYLFE